MKMNKKDYQLFAEVISKIESEDKREEIIKFLKEIFLTDNILFDESKFREFIRRRISGESLKGLNVNPKYLYS
jgi:hypothetical protein